MVKPYSYILDLGFAQSPNLKLQNEKVVGVDLNCKNKPDNYKKIIKADVMCLSEIIEHNTVDAIYCGELLEHLENPIKFLRECRKVLINNGIIVLSTPNPHSIYETFLTIFMIKKYFYTKDHICIYPQRWIIRMFEIAGFKEVKIKSGGLSIPFLGTIPFFRTFGHYTIVKATK